MCYILEQVVGLSFVLDHRDVTLNLCVGIFSTPHPGPCCISCSRNRGLVSVLLTAGDDVHNFTPPVFCVRSDH